MSDLPAMYRSYEKIADPDEAGIADFIGDYLFAGKALLGHNKTDKSESPGNSVQFQHVPNSSNFFFSELQLPCPAVEHLIIRFNHKKDQMETSGFHYEPYRPPLV